MKTRNLDKEKNTSNKSGEMSSPQEIPATINEYGQVTIEGSDGRKIKVMTIIGEIEGHDVLSSSSKSTKYEHILPELASIEDSGEYGGVLFLINTVGGDVSAGLALAEMIASMSKPTVSLVLGDAHSIGVPLTVSADYSFIAPTATVIVHPVRMNGTIIGAPQTFDYFKLIQDRIVRFIVSHASIDADKLEEMMIRAGVLTKDLGTILVGDEAVKAGIIDEVGGISEALAKLKSMIVQN